jgi:hypothetical protein
MAQYLNNKRTAADKVGIAQLDTTVTETTATTSSLADLQHDGITTVIADIETDIDSVL